jgi:ketosteroid isomerase-like protein
LEARLACHGAEYLRAVSRENVEIAQAAMEAFARRDIDGMLAHWHADAEWRPAISPGGLEGTTYVGHEGARRWVAELEESWETFALIDPSFEAVGDRVLVLARVHAKGYSSGVEIDAPLAQVWEIDDEKVRRLTGFSTHVEALEAVGLAE